MCCQLEVLGEEFDDQYLPQDDQQNHDATLEHHVD